VRTDASSSMTAITDSVDKTVLPDAATGQLPQHSSPVEK
jgi:hypothetical protein